MSLVDFSLSYLFDHFDRLLNTSPSSSPASLPSPSPSHSDPSSLNTPTSSIHHPHPLPSPLHPSAKLSTPPATIFARIRSPTVSDPSLPSISQTIMTAPDHPLNRTHPTTMNHHSPSLHQALSPTSHVSTNSSHHHPSHTHPNSSARTSDSLQAALLSTLNNRQSPQHHDLQQDSSHPPNTQNTLTPIAATHDSLLISPRSPHPPSLGSAPPANHHTHEHSACLQQASPSAAQISYHPHHQLIEQTHEFGFTSPFQTANNVSNSHPSQAKPSHDVQSHDPSVVGLGSTAVPSSSFEPSSNLSRDHPDSLAEKFPDSHVQSLHSNKSHTKPTGMLGGLSAATDLLSGSPAPGPMSSTSTSPHQGGAVPLVPTAINNDPQHPAHAPCLIAEAGAGVTSDTALADSPAYRSRFTSDALATPLDQLRPEDEADQKLRRYMAVYLVEQIKSKPSSNEPMSIYSPPSQWRAELDEAATPQNGQHKPMVSEPSSAIDSPRAPPSVSSVQTEKFTPSHNIGLRINSSFPPQELVISTDRINQEILYTADPPPHVLPITLFPSSMTFSPGRKVAVDGFISYATKAGRIRVIDQNSGARMLLRKHEGPVIDMCISRPRGLVGEANSSSRRWRCIGSIGSDGRLVIWKVPVRFEEDTAGYEVLVDIVSHETQSTVSGPEPHPQPPSPKLGKFTALRWHPRDPSVMLVSTSDHRLVLVRLDRGAFGGMWKRGMPLGKSLSEAEAFEGQDVLRTNCKVVAFAFSPDGSAIAFVTEDNILTVRQTSKPHWTIMGGQLRSHDSPVTKLEFLCTPQGVLKGFLISKRAGTRVEIVNLSEVSDVVVTIDLQPPEDQQGEPLPFFGHIAWQAQYSTILLSNSLRGSVFAFHLSFPQVSEDEEMLMSRSMTGTDGGRSPQQDDDSSYIERIAATRQTSRLQRSRSNSWAALRTMFVDHISEVPSPDPIISFVLDEGMRPAPGPSSSDCSIFNIHPKGIHQLYLPREVMERRKASDQGGLTVRAPTARRRSLAGEILVDVQVEEEVSHAEAPGGMGKGLIVSAGGRSEALAINAPSGQASIAQGLSLHPSHPAPSLGVQISPTHQSQSDIVNTESVAGSSNTVAGKDDGPKSCLQPAMDTGSMARNRKQQVGRQVQGKGRQPNHNHSISSPAELAGVRPSGRAGSGENMVSFVDGTMDEEEGAVVVSEELRKIKEEIKEEVKAVVQREMEKQEKRIEEDRASRQASETTRQETLVKLVSTTLTKNTSKTIEQVVKNEMKGSVLMGLNKTLEMSLQEHVRKGVQEGLKKSLGHELERAMTKPDTIGQISKVVMNGMDRIIEERIGDAIKGAVLPVMAETAKAQQTGLKAIAKELGGVCRGLEEARAEAREKKEVRELRATVVGMQQQMAEMQEAFKQLIGGIGRPSSGHPVPVVHLDSSPAETGSVPVGSAHPDSYRTYTTSEQELRALHPHLHGHPSGTTPVMSNSPQAVPAEQHHSRPQTPRSAYEDMFLEALSDPSARSLGKLIDEGDHDRLEAVFKMNGQWTTPVLSQPVVLTLAHKLSDEICKAGQADAGGGGDIGGVGDEEGGDEVAGGRLLGKQGANRLRWIWSCVRSVDYKDQQTSQYLDRVLDLCMKNLMSRKLRMVELDGPKEEINGINEVLKLIQEKIRS